MEMSGPSGYLVRCVVRFVRFVRSCPVFLSGFSRIMITAENAYQFTI